MPETRTTESPPAPPELASAPCVLDIEASGFGRDSYPIEVGFVLADGHAHCSLVRPAAGWTHWDDDAERVHGIARERVVNHGRAPADVAALMNLHLKGLTVYCDGWAHDYPWLAMLFEAAGLSPQFRLEHLRSLLTEAQAQALHEVRARVVSDMQLTRHRASSDARALQLAVMRLRAGASH
jgi:hypothetical protein